MGGADGVWSEGSGEWTPAVDETAVETVEGERMIELWREREGLKTIMS